MAVINNILGLLKKMFVPEKVQVTLLSSNYSEADFGDIVEAVSILYRQTC